MLESLQNLSPFKGWFQAAPAPAPASKAAETPADGVDAGAGKSSPTSSSQSTGGKHAPAPAAPSAQQPGLARTKSAGAEIPPVPAEHGMHAAAPQDAQHAAGFKQVNLTGAKPGQIQSCLVKRCGENSGRFEVIVTLPGTRESIKYSVAIDPADRIQSHADALLQVAEMVGPMISTAHKASPGFKQVVCTKAADAQTAKVEVFDKQNRKIDKEIEVPHEIATFLGKAIGAASTTLRQHEAERHHFEPESANNKNAKLAEAQERLAKETAKAEEANHEQPRQSA